MSRREIWFLVLLVCGSLVTSAVILRPIVPPRNDPRPNGIEAFAAVRSIMQQSGRSERTLIAAGWRDFASVLERDRKLKTTGELRTACQGFEELLWAKTNLAGAFPGFSQAANDGLKQALGAEDRPLDRTAAVAAIRALAAACEVPR